VQAVDLAGWDGDRDDARLVALAAGIRRILNENDGGEDAAESAYKRALAHYEKRDYESAIDEFSKVIAMNSRHAGAFFNRARAYDACHEWDRAIADFSKAIAIDPSHPPSFSFRGTAYLFRKDFELAIADFTETIRLGQAGAWDYVNRGTAKELKEDYDGAVQDFTRAIEIDSNDATNYACRASSLVKRKRSGDRERAIADYRKTLEIEPSQIHVKKALKELGVQG
jgi:tetratricopeptide (TPR) repeat protein